MSRKLLQANSIDNGRDYLHNKTEYIISILIFSQSQRSGEAENVLM